MKSKLNDFELFFLLPFLAEPYAVYQQHPVLKAPIIV